MVHYFFFVSLVNQNLFYCMACIFTKLAKIEPNLGEKRKSTLLNKFGNFQMPLLNWLCIKYNYHFKITILIHSISTMTDPIAYFYNLVKITGTTAHRQFDCLDLNNNLFRKVQCYIDQAMATYIVDI